MAKKIHLLFEPAFLFEQDICRDGLQTRGNRERHGVRKIKFERFQRNFFQSKLGQSLAVDMQSGRLAHAGHGRKGNRADLEIGDIVGVLEAWEVAQVRRSIWEEGHGMV